MNNIYKSTLISIPLMFLLTGCGVIGDKSMSMSIIYVATTVLSFLLLLGYACLSQKKNVWFLLLFSSVFIVNAGYLSLSVSTELREALLANRISYFGSVFLPMSMFMLILESCNFTYKKWFPLLLMCLGIPVFLIAGSPGFSDIYYQSVTLSSVNGITVLDKVYGSWHSIYLYYLVIYFGAMIGVITYSVIKKKVKSHLRATILFTAVFTNISIWLLEQLVHIEFEMLSISYIASELFMLSLNLLYKEHKKAQVTNEPEQKIITTPEQKTVITVEQPVDNIQSKAIEEVKNESELFAEKCEYFASQIKNLTPTEHAIYELYLSKKSTKEVLDILNIKETTLKYHNKNIYSKLGVSSKRQLLEIAAVILK